MSTMTAQNPIKFYDKNAQYNFLANTMDGFPIDFNIDGHQFNAKGGSEGVFQSSRLYASAKEKSQNKSLAYQETNVLCSMSGAAQQSYKNDAGVLVNGKTPVKQHFASKQFDGKYTGGGSPAIYPDGTPLELKERIMYETLLMKATQHPAVLRELLATGSTPIVENTSLAPYDDPYWGNGRSGNGRNALGKLWEMVRNDLRTESSAGAIRVRTGFSPELSNNLGVTSAQFHPTLCVNKVELNTAASRTPQAFINYATGHNSMGRTNNSFSNATTVAPTAHTAPTVASTAHTAPVPYTPSTTIADNQKDWLKTTLANKSGIPVSDVMLAGDGKIHVAFNNPTDAAKYSAKYRNADLAGNSVVLTHGKAQHILTSV